MDSKRAPERHKKRLSVHFGIEEASRVAFTEDVSINGMFIKSCNVCPPNTKIWVEFTLENDARVVLEARVMWAKKVPPQLIHIVKKCGMGVRILRVVAGEDAFRQYCNELETIR